MLNLDSLNLDGLQLPFPDIDQQMMWIDPIMMSEEHQGMIRMGGGYFELINASVQTFGCVI